MSSVFYSEFFQMIVKLMGITILYSFVFSLILMMAKGLFFKLEKQPSSALIPVYNLFVLNEGLEINPILTILYFVPFINLGFYVYICYKLGYIFKQSYDFRLGLVFFPYIFFYTLSNSKSELTRFEEERNEEERQATLNDALLYTDEKLKNLNEEDEKEEENKVDSIFKSELSLKPEAPAYRASIKKGVTNLDFDAIDGNHKVIFVPSPRTSVAKEDIIKKVETSYIDSSSNENKSHEDEIDIYEIK